MKINEETEREIGQMMREQYPHLFEKYGEPPPGGGQRLVDAISGDTVENGYVVSGQDMSQ